MLIRKIHQQAPEVMEQDHGYDFKAGKKFELVGSRDTLTSILLFPQSRHLELRNNGH